LKIQVCNIVSFILNKCVNSHFIRSIEMLKHTMAVSSKIRMKSKIENTTDDSIYQDRITEITGNLSQLITTSTGRSKAHGEFITSN
jgi:hypothetical protein